MDCRQVSRLSWNSCNFYLYLNYHEIKQFDLKFYQNCQFCIVQWEPNWLQSGNMVIASGAKRALKSVTDTKQMDIWL